MHERPSSSRGGAPFDAGGTPETEGESAARAAPQPEVQPERQVSGLGRLRLIPVTSSVIALSVSLHALAMLWGENDDVLWRMGANRGEDVVQGQIYRLLACTFLHAGWTHLFMNMTGLLALCGLELMLGWRRFLVLYAISGLVGSLATALYSPEVLSVGASGAIFGVMFAAFGFRLGARRVLASRGVKLTAGLSMLPLIVASSFMPGVDTTAHFGGGLAGFVLGAWVLRPAWSRGPGAHDPRDGKGPILTAAAGVAAATMIASLAAALGVGQAWRYADVPSTSSIRIGQTPLSMTLPDVLGSDLILESPGFAYGTNRRAPIVLQVALDSDQGPPADALEANYRSLRHSPTADGVRRTAFGLVTLDGRRVIREEFEHQDEIKSVRYHTFVAGYRVGLVFWRRAPERVWPGIEEEIVSSLRVD